MYIYIYVYIKFRIYSGNARQTQSRNKPGTFEKLSNRCPMAELFKSSGFIPGLCLPHISGTNPELCTHHTTRWWYISRVFVGGTVRQNTISEKPGTPEEFDHRIMLNYNTSVPNDTRTV